MEKQEFFRRLNEKLGVLPPGGGIADPCSLIGAVRYELRGSDGRLKQEGMFHNLVNSIGDRWVAHYLISSIVGDTRSMWAELGVNTTAPLKGDTGLGTLVNASSVAVTGSYPTRVTSFSGTGEWTVWQFDWAAGAATNGSLGEVGMRTQAGSFVAHALLVPNVAKGANDSLMVQWAWKPQGA